jgi:hypothetical protein
MARVGLKLRIRVVTKATAHLEQRAEEIEGETCLKRPYHDFPCFSSQTPNRIGFLIEGSRAPGRFFLLDEATLKERMTASPGPAAQDAFGHRLQPPTLNVDCDRQDEPRRRDATPPLTE